MQALEHRGSQDVRGSTAILARGPLRTPVASPGWWRGSASSHHRASKTSAVSSRSGEAFLPIPKPAQTTMSPPFDCGRCLRGLGALRQALAPEGDQRRFPVSSETPSTTGPFDAPRTHDGACLPLRTQPLPRGQPFADWMPVKALDPRPVASLRDLTFPSVPLDKILLS